MQGTILGIMMVPLWQALKSAAGLRVVSLCSMYISPLNFYLLYLKNSKERNTLLSGLFPTCSQQLALNPGAKNST